MAPTSSAEFDTQSRSILLDIAAASISHGFTHGSALTPSADPAVARDSESLLEQRATFVTLTNTGGLRGCIGSLAPHLPLLVDVARNAFSSAFRDPRFPPLQPQETTDLVIEISVLSPVREIEVADESDLLARLRPGIDGLVIDDGRHRATFLPKVWDSLPAPDQFLAALKHKAGMARGQWSRDMRVFVYHTETFAGDGHKIRSRPY